MSFHNPYQFIPASPRQADGWLGDQRPVGHHQLVAHRWTGRLTVTLTTVTPLLVPDNGEDAEGGHRRYGTRVSTDADAAERVYLPSTSVKGMLRSAYEAVTNSRMGVFTHRVPLGYRSEARNGLAAVPVLVRLDAAGLPKGAMAAAWLDVADRDVRTVLVRPVALPSYAGPCPPCRYPDGSSPRHGDRVTAWVELVERKPYWYWRAVSLWRSGVDPDQLRPDVLGRRESARHVALGPGALVRGVVHRTNHNIRNKHDERLFLVECAEADDGIRVQPGRRLKLPADVWTAYQRLVADYRQQHVTERRDDIWTRRAPHRPWEVADPRNDVYAWSRHLYDVNGPHAPDGLTAADVAAQGPDALRPDGWVTCYGLLPNAGGGAEPDEIIELLPVLISRRLHGRAPWDAVPRRVEPAATLKQLSPADRVFGWVRQPRPDETTRPAESREDLAVRGALRIGPVRGPLATEALAEVNLSLEILSAPKPAQGRFYMGVAGPDRLPQPMPPTSTRSEFFGDGQVLRGRKVYPHQRDREVDEVYWDPRRGSAKDKEYRRLGDKTDDQNRTMATWVRPGQTFSFTIDVRNLDDTELGALLWLLDPDRFGEPARPGRHRLGLGKALGFGSVIVALADDGHDLRRGEDWAADFTSLGTAPLPDPQGWRVLAERFEQQASTSEDMATILATVRAAAIGYADGLPVHHPRAAHERDPDGKNYEWFVANESGRQPDCDPLPLFGKSLPYKQRQRDQPQQGGQRRQDRQRPAGQGRRRT